MQQQTTTTDHADALSQSVDHLIARQDALIAAALATGLEGPGWDAFGALRHAAEFLDQASAQIAGGLPFDSPEVVTPFLWAVMKTLEFHDALPVESRAGLSSENAERHRAIEGHKVAKRGRAR